MTYKSLRDCCARACCRRRAGPAAGTQVCRAGVRADPVGHQRGGERGDCGDGADAGSEGAQLHGGPERPRRHLRHRRQGTA